MNSRTTSRCAAVLTTLIISASLLGAQTKITAPKNKYSPADDVKLGRDAAADVRQQLPLMNDDLVASYVADLGRRLANIIPNEYQHAEFRYTFETVNVREINAFALPGGPMFVNRGMIEAANTEGEVVGVMAHELSHVLLRHGTAQATKATKYQIGSILGAIGGAIIGGNAGAAVSQISQFGFSAAFTRFSREYEKQADILGAQLMARANYDARDMASMFKTIEKQGGSGGPEWLSDHPNPGNRADYITKEAAMLRVENPIRNSAAFDRVREHLRGLPKAPTTEEATKNKKRGGGSTSGRPAPTGRVPAPSTRYTEYREGDIFRVSVPSNWDELPETSSVTFAPAGGYGNYNGQSVFTHGVQIGLSGSQTHDLQTATDELIDSLRQGNPRMGRPSGYRNQSLGGRRGLQTTVDNVSDVTGQRETIQITTAQLGSGDLIYAIFVAPGGEFTSYQPVFQRVLGSIRLLQ
jgi:Zn-dependent protease with chaperone function